jgi:hypothetical protein
MHNFGSPVIRIGFRFKNYFQICGTLYPDGGVITDWDLFIAAVGWG